MTVLVLDAPVREVSADQGGVEDRCAVHLRLTHRDDTETVLTFCTGSPARAAWLVGRINEQPKPKEAARRGLALVETEEGDAA